MRRTAGAPALPARLLAVLAVLVMVGSGLGACRSSDPGHQPGALATGCEELERYRSLDGEVVTMTSALSGSEIARFEQSLEFFEECTGIDVVLTATDSMETDLLSAAASSQASGASTASASLAAQGADEGTAGASGQELPDLAVVPQPGVVAELADAGLLTELPKEVRANTEVGWNREWAQVGTYDGTAYAAPLMASVKSFVWFSPTAFKQAGYSVPRSWDEMESLTAQVVKDHPDGSVTPWCLGLGDGRSTGWAMTDWLEDAMLATQGTSAYDAWASHEVALDDSSAVEALETARSLLLTRGHVAGGGGAAATRSVEQAGTDLVEGRCLMLHASSSYESMLPEGTAVTDVTGGSPAAYPAGSPTASSTAPSSASPAPSAGEAAGTSTPAPAGSQAEGTSGDAGTQPSETGSPAATSASSGPAATQTPTRASTGGAVSAFLLPPDDRSSEPAMVGADYLVALSGRDAATAVMEYLTSADWAQRRVSLGGVATAHQAVDASQIPSDVARRATTLLQSREATVRMDASDSMPAEVGTQALWESLTRWAAGDLSSAQALAQAEKSWPRGK